MKKENAIKAAKMLITKSPKDRESLENTLNFLSFLSRLYKREREVKDFILNPLIQNETKVAYLQALAESFNLPKETKDVIKQLVELNLIPLIGDIRRAFQYEVEKALRLSKGFLVVATAVDKEVVEKIRERISKILDRDVSLEVQEDPSIIGGFIVKMPSFVIDASVRRSLERLGG